MKKFFLIGLCWLVVGCSERERTNPFDPKNPETNGVPIGVTIQSNRSAVRVQWTPVDVNSLGKYIVYRQLENGVMHPFDTVLAEQNTLLDTNVLYDRRYSYAIQACTIYDDGALSDTVSIIPGAVNFWCTHFYDNRVQKICYDGAHLLGQSTLSAPIAVAVNTSDDVYLVADYWRNKIYSMNSELAILGELTLQDQPVDIAYDPDNDRLFVLLRGANVLQVFDMNGSLIESELLNFEITINSQIEINYADKDAWIATNGTDSLYRVNYRWDPPLNLTYYVPGLNRICADPIQSTCWAATDSGIVKIISGYERCTYFTDRFISDVSINPTNGNCYYASYRYADQQWETGYLNAEADYVDKPILGNEYPSIRRIKSLTGTGSQGFLVLQGQTWKLIRFDAQGEKIGEMEGFQDVIDIAIE